MTSKVRGEKWTKMFRDASVRQTKRKTIENRIVEKMNEKTKAVDDYWNRKNCTESLWTLQHVEKRHCTQRDSRVSVSRATRLVKGSNYAIWNSYSDPSESEDGGEGGGEAYQSSEKLRTFGQC